MTASAKGQKKRTSISPMTLRLTPEERARLDDLAAGMTLSAYIRACLFSESEKRRKHRPKSVVADKKAAAEALALLGQSRIASNLNQLAYHANIGALNIGEAEKSQISEAYDYVLAVRSLLMCALGKRSSARDPGDRSEQLPETVKSPQSLREDFHKASVKISTKPSRPLNDPGRK